MSRDGWDYFIVIISCWEKKNSERLLKGVNPNLQIGISRHQKITFNATMSHSRVLPGRHLRRHGFDSGQWYKRRKSKNNYTNIREIKFKKKGHPFHSRWHRSENPWNDVTRQHVVKFQSTTTMTEETKETQLSYWGWWRGAGREFGRGGWRQTPVPLQNFYQKLFPSFASWRDYILFGHLLTSSQGFKTTVWPGFKALRGGPGQARSIHRRCKRKKTCV